MARSLFLLAALWPATSIAGTLVVLNKSDATATLIDDATGKVKATLPTGEAPHEVAISGDGRVAVAGNYGTRAAPGSSLTVIDIPAARVLRTIDLGEYQRPHGIVWLADGEHVVVTAEANRALLTVHVGTGRVVRAAPTGQETSHMVAVTPDGTRAFVANIRSNSVTAIELASGRTLAVLRTGDGAEGIDVSPDGSEVWVTNRGSDNVSVVDARRLVVTGVVPCASFPIRAKVTPDGKRVLVSNARSGDLAVLDRRGRRVHARLKFTEEAAVTSGRLFGDTFGKSPVPIGIAIRPDGRRAWVAHTNADVIAVVDLERLEVSGTLTAGREPDGLAYSPVTLP